MVLVISHIFIYITYWLPPKISCIRLFTGCLSYKYHLKYKCQFETLTNNNLLVETNCIKTSINSEVGIMRNLANEEKES